MIRIGLIGCGEHCSRTHAKVLSELDQVQIVAISECILPGELVQRQQQFRIPYAFSNYEEMIRFVELDAVVISTPHVHHFIQVKSCLERRLHVLVDKPPACRTQDIQRLVALADLAGCHLLVASQRRYDPVFQRIREEIKDGKLGDLLFLELHYSRSKSVDFERSWRNDPALSGGGVLLDAGYHIMDTLLWLTNDRPVHIHGYLNNQGTQVETQASLRLEMRSNASAVILIHLETPRSLVREEICLFGTKGAILYQYNSLQNGTIPARLISTYTQQEGVEEVQRSKEIDEMPARNLVGAILRDERVISSGRDSIETVDTIEMIYNVLHNI